MARAAVQNEEVFGFVDRIRNDRSRNSPVLAVFDVAAMVAVLFRVQRIRLLDGRRVRCVEDKGVDAEIGQCRSFVVCKAFLQRSGVCEQFAVFSFQLEITADSGQCVLASADDLRRLGQQPGTCIVGRTGVVTDHDRLQQNEEHDHIGAAYEFDQFVHVSRLFINSRLRAVARNPFFIRFRRMPTSPALRLSFEDPFISSGTRTG